MVKLNDFALEVQSKLNAIAEFLGKDNRFIITDTVQEYETYIVLKDGENEYNYTPGIARILTPIMPSTRVGLYTGTYEIELYGYTDERNDVEEIFNFYMKNYSGMTFMLGGYNVGFDIGSFNITNATRSTQDGFNELGDRFTASILFNLSTGLNAELNKGNEIKVFIDGTKIAYENIQLRNTKSVLNTEFNPAENNKLVTDSITLTIPLTKAKLERFSLVGEDYVLDENGDYMRTEYDGVDYYYLINTQRYDLVDEDYVESECGKYILIIAEGIPTYIIPQINMLEDENGTEKINELFSIGLSGKYNTKNTIRLVFPQHEKTADYIYTNFNLNVNNQNVPISFTIDYTLAYTRCPVLIDGAMLNIVSFSGTNSGIENVSTEKVGDNIVAKSLIESSVKNWTAVIEHDNSEVSSALLSEIINDLTFESSHTLTIKLPAFDGFIEKEYLVILKNGDYTLDENGVMTYTVNFAERGD
jgi:hypothetical protein